MAQEMAAEGRATRRALMADGDRDFDPGVKVGEVVKMNLEVIGEIGEIVGGLRDKLYPVTRVLPAEAMGKGDDNSGEPQLIAELQHQYGLLTNLRANLRDLHRSIAL